MGSCGMKRKRERIFFEQKHQGVVECVVFISWSHIVWFLLLSLASNVAHNAAARVLLEYAGHFYEQSGIVLIGRRRTQLRRHASTAACPVIS
jgi:hypothetical protein